MHFFLRLPAIIRYSLTFSDKKSQIGYPVKKLKHFIIDLEQFQFRNSSPKKNLANLVSIFDLCLSRNSSKLWFGPLRTAADCRWIPNSHEIQGSKDLGP